VRPAVDKENDCSILSSGKEKSDAHILSKTTLAKATFVVLLRFVIYDN
jgi:hypothetical protein